MFEPNYSIQPFRYVLQGSRWKVKDITYRVTKYPLSSGLSQWDVSKTFSSRISLLAQVDRAIEMAADVWERAGNITFTRSQQGTFHIDIRFEK